MGLVSQDVEVLKRYQREELRLAEEYQKVAEGTSHETVKSFYIEQSAECRKHHSILEKVLTLIGEVPREPVAEESPPSRAEIIEIGIRELYSILKGHLKVEKNAEETYMRMAERAGDPRVKNLLLGLASDEKHHHEHMILLIKDLEQEYGSILK